jgi:sigma-B regulation protein RsbU (phosphoserine phosphatase)
VKDTSQKTIAVPLIHEPHFSWKVRVPNALLLLILPYLAILLGFWIALVRPRDPLAWLVLAIMTSYFCFGESSVEQWGPYVRDLAVAFRTTAQSTFPIWLLLFGIYFPEPFPANSRWAHWHWLKWVFIIPLALFAFVAVIRDLGWLENYASVAFLGATPKALQIANAILTYMALGWPLGLILVKYQSAISADAKRRLRLLAASAAIALGPFFLLQAAAVIKNVILEEYFPEWLWFSTYVLYYLFPLALAYLIVVHRALDVRVVLRQGLQYALAKNGVTAIQLILTTAVFFAAVTLVAGGARNRVERIVLIVLGLVVVVGIRRGSARLRTWIDRRFFREAYNAEQILSELSDRVRTMVEPASLLETVATRISATMHVTRIAVLLDGSPYRPAYAIGCEAVSDLSFPAESATVRTLQTQREPVRVYLEDRDSWIYREGESTEVERAQLSNLQTELLLPLSTRDKLLGFMSLGPKRSEEPFTGNDLRLLKSVATQTGLALENAKLVAAITEEVAQRERLNREVEIAREVQERLFPQELPPIAGLDYSGACRPALGVGGDYYDFLALPEGRLGIAIGDVSGKGIGAALLMASLQASLRAEATRGTPVDLAALIANVNRLVYQSSTSNRYATFFYAQYDPAHRELTYVNAGHNAPMLFRKGEEVIRLTAGGTVVGLLETFPYQQETLKLNPGDLLVAFTDGISEAMNASEEEWGEERLMQAVESFGSLPAAELLSQIISAADGFAAGAKQHDDMTLVVLRVES